MLHTRHGDLDVFGVDQTAGAPPTYEQLRGRAIALQLRGVTLRVAHPEDLIAMKTAAAGMSDRPDVKRRQDRDDIAALQRLVSQHGAASEPRGPKGPGPTRRASFPPRGRGISP